MEFIARRRVGLLLWKGSFVLVPQQDSRPAEMSTVFAFPTTVGGVIALGLSCLLCCRHWLSILSMPSTVQGMRYVLSKYLLDWTELNKGEGME